jgi:IMP dehydrogenase
MAGNREEFFEDMHGSPNHTYLAYNDVGLRTERVAGVDWEGLDFWEIDTRTQISRNIWLPGPITTAAMNCISEDDMAIAMAKSGGASFVHHINTPDEQRDLVQNVYHYLAGIIEKPVTAQADSSVRETQIALEKIHQKYRTNGDSQLKRQRTFETLPVIEDGKCVGIMDSLAFALAKDNPDLLVKDAMHPLSEDEKGEAGMNPNQVLAIMKARKVGRIVLLKDNGNLAGLCMINDIMRVVDSNPNKYSLDKNGRLIVMASVPTIPEDAIERAHKLEGLAKGLLIDTSHGEQKHAIETLKALQKENLSMDLIAGNLSTEQAAYQIAKLGPDGLSAGQGPGQICLSSDRLRFGTPQASAVYEVVKGARRADPSIPVIADGGIKEPGDTVVALACGASAVRVGSLVAGTDEQPVPIEIDKNGFRGKPYWGMGSKRAQTSWKEARARYGNYRAFDRIFIEGFEKLVELKGPAEDVIADHIMGLRISMMSQGMANIDDLHQYAKFMRGYSGAGKN